MSADLIFYQKHKTTLIDYQSSQSKSARLEWSAFAGFFSQAQWQSICVLWGLILMEPWNGCMWL